MAEIARIHGEFAMKFDRAVDKIWTLNHEQYAKAVRVLTEEQRDRLPGLLRGLLHQEVHKVISQLDLGGGQRDKVHATCTQFEKKLCTMAEQPGNTTCRHVRVVVMEFTIALRRDLTADQCAALADIVGHVKKQWRSPVYVLDQLLAIENELGLNSDQRRQVIGTFQEYVRKLKEPFHDLGQLNQEELLAIKEVLTAEQATKLGQLVRWNGPW
jgi:hypothetical protein